MTLHLAIRESLQVRIQSGEWELGARIPDEADFAEEYGCARATINRALQALAADGLVVRKRKGGTRVNPSPARWAKVEIPIVREEVEALGSAYRHRLMQRKIKTPPAPIRSPLQMNAGDKALYLETLHLADDRPFAFETRWVNTDAIPAILDAPLEAMSVNEWLVRSVPFSSGDVAFAASNANETIASALEVEPEEAVFRVDRTTWLDDRFITAMKLFYRKDYQIYFRI